MRVQSLRSDPLPLTWEIPTALILCWALGALLALPAGQGISHVVSGEPFAWPTGRLPQSVVGLVSGRPGVGLPSSAPDAPPAVAVYACIAVVEVVLTVLVVWVASGWWRTIGPGAQIGLATRHEARAVLGKGALRRRGKTIRPDLAQRARFTGRGQS